MPGLDPGIHRLQVLDCRVICAKTRFALLPGNDETITSLEVNDHGNP
jgi:hypothetical protein